MIEDDCPVSMALLLLPIFFLCVEEIQLTLLPAFFFLGIFDVESSDCTDGTSPLSKVLTLAFNFRGALDGCFFFFVFGVTSRSVSLLFFVLAY